MDVILRPAASEDVGEMMVLLKDLYDHDVGRGFSGILDEYLRHDSHCVLVAVVAGRTVGLLIGSYRLDFDYECRAGLIDAIVVTKELQGRGLGRALIGGFAEWAGNEGCTTLQVINGAREFFEAMGFAERQVTFHQVPMDGLAVAGRPANGV